MSSHTLCRLPDKCLSPHLSRSVRPERVKSLYFSGSREESAQTCRVKCVGSFTSTDRAPLPVLIVPLTVAHGNN
jgi:hypothetical protein